TLGVLFCSFYLQYIVGLYPCPLCLMQRLCVFLLLILMGLRLGTLRKAHVISLVQVLVAGAGLFFSLRQLWLQSMPAGKAPACLPGLDILMAYFPWQTVAKVLFWGTGECAEVTWAVFGISLAGWGALYFLVMVFFNVLLYMRTKTP
ncbi:MAG: disulfide bond formation protein B, partial [Legionellales bacterium]